MRLRVRCRAVRGPIYLTADSLLWSRPDGLASPFVQRLRGELSPGVARAAYVGASNGDEPAYYAFFERLMDMVGVEDRAMVRSVPGAEGRARLAEADLILLAGGDVERGWRVIEASGMSEVILARHRAAAVLVGVSAGAVQLGRPAMFSLVPWLIDVHREGEGWAELRGRVARSRGEERGLGIPHGGAVGWSPDGAAEHFGEPPQEFRYQAGAVVATGIGLG